jgi:hypothetical protein
MSHDQSRRLTSLAALVFFGTSLVAVAGWSYIFLTETYPNLSGLGVFLAIGLGIGMAPAWMATGTIFTALIMVRREWTRPTWIAVFFFAWVVGGVFTLLGWAYYLGQGV